MTRLPVNPPNRSAWGGWIARRQIASRGWRELIARGAEHHFLVVGVPRSGTTLLSSKLAGHPDAICLDEPWLHWQRFGKFPLPERAARLLGEPVPWSRGIPAKALARLAGQVTRAGLKETFRDGGYWPGFGNTDLLESLADLMPRGRTVVIVRNPLAVWNSVRNRRMGRTGAPDKAVSSRFTRNWNELVDWTDARGIEPFRYEDLVREPVEGFRMLCVGVGLRFEKAMLDADAAAKPEKPGHPSTRGVFASSERRFETELPERDETFIRRECGPGMGRFGYGS